MSIAFQAEHTGYGILLTRIERRSDAQKLRNYFHAHHVPATLGLLCDAGDQRVFLPNLTAERFVTLAESAIRELA